MTKRKIKVPHYIIVQLTETYETLHPYKIANKIGLTWTQKQNWDLYGTRPLQDRTRGLEMDPGHQTGYGEI